MDGYTLKKPHLSVEEALAFSLAKKLLGNLGPGMQKSLDTIEEKLSFKKPPGILAYILFTRYRSRAEWRGISRLFIRLSPITRK